MRILRQGDRGADVADMQRKLALAGYSPGAADGIWGVKTSAALLAFQVDRPDLEDDKIFGPMSSAALDAAVSSPSIPPSPTPAIVPCNAPTWDAFQQYIVEPIVSAPVCYGPGRGLWDPTLGRFLVTYAPGRRTEPGDLKRWPNVLGKFYPAFHCTSFTNVVLSWLDRRNGLFTHAGNIPSLQQLCETDSSLHTIPNGGAYRGFKEVVSAIAPDGSGAKRVGIANVMDAREFLARARAGTLPTFCAFMQSTKTGAQINWWHHTGFFISWQNKLFRIAADGYKGANGYSAARMRYVEITDMTVGAYDRAFYRAYGVDTADGSYGPQDKPIARLAFE